MKNVQQVSDHTLGLPDHKDDNQIATPRRSQTIDQDQNKGWGSKLITSIVSAPMKLFRSNARNTPKIQTNSVGIRNRQ
jgi:hypothetical protein